MGRTKKSVMEERKENFREALRANLSEGEIQERLGLSEVQVRTLMGSAASERWPEFKTWQPTSDVIQAKKLPGLVLEMVREASGLENPNECRLVRVVNENGEVILRCVGSERDQKAIAGGRRQAALPSRKAQALPPPETDKD